MTKLTIEWSTIEFKEYIRKNVNLHNREFLEKFDFKQIYIKEKLIYEDESNLFRSRFYIHCTLYSVQSRCIRDYMPLMISGLSLKGEEKGKGYKLFCSLKNKFCARRWTYYVLWLFKVNEHFLQNVRNDYILIIKSFFLELYLKQSRYEIDQNLLKL